MPIMNLRDFIANSGMTQTDFAKQIGETQQVVNVWALGKAVPRTAAMHKIVEATNGAVTPNDFLPAPASDQPGKAA